MSAKLRLVWLACLSACVLPASAQLNSSALHAKFGAPLHREVFHLPAGFDMSVNYGPVDQVCSLEVPALMPSNEKVQNGDQMRQRMTDFLADLVPDAMRGAKLREMASMMGIVSVQSIEYEHVTISQFSNANPREATITVSFTGNGCPAAHE